jgi:hypothetical protein
MVVQNLSMVLREEVLEFELRFRIGSIGLRSHSHGVAEIILEARPVLYAGLLNLLTLNLALLHAILLSDDLCLVLRVIVRNVTIWLRRSDGSVVSARLLRLLNLRIVGPRLDMISMLSELRSLLHGKISLHLWSLLRNVEGSHLISRQGLVVNNLRRVDWRDVRRHLSCSLG